MPGLAPSPRRRARRRAAPRPSGRLLGAALAGASATLITASPAWAASPALAPDGDAAAPARAFLGLLALASSATAAGQVLLSPLAASATAAGQVLPRPHAATAAGQVLLRPLAAPPRAGAAPWLAGAAVTAATAHLLVLGFGRGGIAALTTVALAAATLALLRYAGRPALGVPLALAVAVGAALLELPAATPAGALASAGHGVSLALLLGGLAWLATTAAPERGPVARRLAPWAVAAVTAEAAAFTLRLGHDRAALGLEGPSWTGPLRWLCLASAAAGALGLAALAHRRCRPDRALLPGQAVALPAAVLIVIVATAAALPTPAARPGTPLLATLDAGGQAVPLVVVPQRPGWNLVHVGAEGVSLGLRPDRLSPAGRLPGAVNGWSLVHLPPGESRLHVAYGGRRATLRLDAGPAGGTGPDLRGADGPECVSAALGALAAGRSTPLTRCPAEALSPDDRDDLAAAVAFLAPRSGGAVSVVGDSSPRSVAAVATVTAAARTAGLRVVPAGAGRHPVLVVTGWAGAEAAIRDATRGPTPALGTYLAPWLLAAPVLRPATGHLLPLRFDPREEAVFRYIAQLARRFPGEPPSASGYLAWRGQALPGPARMYAAATVALPGSGPHAGHGRSGFLPGGTITAVTGPLS